MKKKSLILLMSIMLSQIHFVAEISPDNILLDIDTIPDVPIKFDENKPSKPLQILSEYNVSVKWEKPTGASNNPTIIDIDRDGELEIVFGQTYLDSEGNIEKQGSIGSHWDLPNCIVDIDNDTYADIITCSGSSVYALNHNLTIKWSHNLYSIDGYISNLAVADFNNKGNYRIIVGDANYLYCIGKDGSLQWSRYHGGDDARHRTSIADLDGDGDLEIVSYTKYEIVCLEANKDINWLKSWSGYFAISYMAIGNLDSNDTTLEIIYQDNDGLHCLDSNGNELWLFDSFDFLEGRINDPIIADVNNDGINEIICTSSEYFLGYVNVYCISNQGNVIWKNTNVPAEHTHNIPTVCDLDNDGQLETIVVADNEVYCVNSTGDQVWRYDTGEGLRDRQQPLVVDIDNDSRMEVLFLRTNNNIYCLDIEGSFSSSDMSCVTDCYGFSRTLNVDSDGDYLDDLTERHYGTNLSIKDMDEDGLSDGYELVIYHTDPFDNDTDDDLISDYWEIIAGTNPFVNDSGIDSDGDNITNFDEVVFYGTNPDLFDSDGDGLSDFEEVFTYPSDPNDPDSDDDGLTDWDEIITYGTNSTNADSDYDGCPDQWEISYSFNPMINDSWQDFDLDLLTNYDEYILGLPPDNNDTDSDTLLDGEEILIYFTNPESVDSDEDNLTDAEEIFTYFTLPNDDDTEDDGMTDGWEVNNSLDPFLNDSYFDPDNDTLINYVEYLYNINPFSNDSDSDGMDDAFEVAYRLYPGVNDASVDRDGDGLTNIEEYHYGTDPRDWDTDDDGWRDGFEYLHGFNPLLDDTVADYDLDDLSNYDEYNLGTDMYNPDTDSDGLTDGEEVHIHGTSPLSRDTDEDSLPDNWEVENNLNPLQDDAKDDPDNDLIRNIREYSLGKDPNKFDNWGLLYGVYFLPLWLAILSAAAYLVYVVYQFILRKSKGFLSVNDMNTAEEIGFANGDDFYLAIATGYTTREQWISSSKAGFQTEDEWISALQNGYSDSEIRNQVSELGFSSIFEFRKELTLKLRKIRFRLNKLLTLTVEFEQLDSSNTVKIDKLRNQIRKNHNECRILLDEFYPISSVPTGILEIDNTTKSELEISESLERARKIFVQE